MIASPFIPDNCLTDLFKLESNLKFEYETESLDAVILAVAEVYDLGPVETVHRISKPSPTSILYRLNRPAAPAVMVRRAAPDSAAALSAQCDISARLSGKMFLRPLPSRDGRYTAHVAGGVWMAYPYLAGQIYDGGNFDFLNLIEAVMEFEKTLREIGIGLPIELKNVVPRTHHKTKEWPEFFSMLCSERATKYSELIVKLDKTTRILLHCNASFINQIVRRCTDLQTSGNLDLVHNDLNHANILVGQGNVSFLDVEDIVLERSEISLAHAIFKILRQRVFAGYLSLLQARDEIPDLINCLAKDAIDISSPRAFFDFGATRILSDIHLICSNAVDQGNPKLLYDLEKKIHNLFELWKLTEPANEFATCG